LPLFSFSLLTIPLTLLAMLFRQISQ